MDAWMGCWVDGWVKYNKNQLMRKHYLFLVPRYLHHNVRNPALNPLVRSEHCLIDMLLSRADEVVYHKDPYIYLHLRPWADKITTDNNTTTLMYLKAILSARETD